MASQGIGIAKHTDGHGNCSIAGCGSRRNILPKALQGSHCKNRKDATARSEEFYKAFGRNPRKHGNQEHKRSRSKEQVPVLVLRDRTARTASWVMPRIKKEEIARQMLPVLSQDTVLFTDAFRGFKPVTKSAGIKRITRNQNKGEHSRGVYHIQNVNAGALFVSNPKLIHPGFRRFVH